jgi:hypothetical protein
LVKVPRSLEGRSRKSEEYALIETTTSWENRVGRVRLGHQNSRNLIYKSIPSGSLHQKFLGSLEGRRIKEGISKTRNDKWRVIISITMNFQTSSKL